MKAHFSLLMLLVGCLAASGSTPDEAAKLDAAIAKLDQALRTGGADKAALANELARAQIAAGRPISARQVIERILRDAPAGSQRNGLEFLKARLCEVSSNPAEALTLYRAIAGKVPVVAERADAMAAVVRVAGLMNDESMLDRSLVEFTEAFPQDPRSRDFLVRLYRHRAARGEHKSAAAAAHRFKSAFPQDSAGTAILEFYHLALAGESKAAVAAFEIERKSLGFVLTYSGVSALVEAMRRDPVTQSQIEAVANAFALATGDPQFQVSAVEWLSSGEQAAVALATRILPQLIGSALEARLRLALANALWRGKNADEAEKQLAAVIGLEPANLAAWDKHWEVVSGAKRPEAHQKLIEKELAALPTQKNFSLRSAAQSLLAFRRAQLAWRTQDYAAAGNFAKAFLETDGLSKYGPEVIKIAGDVCFAGLAEAVKAEADSEAAVKTAQKVGKDAVEKARLKVEAARTALEDTIKSSNGKFDALLPSLEKYLTRTVAWGPSLDSIDNIFQWTLRYKPLSGCGKSINSMVLGLRQTDLVKAAVLFDGMRETGKWPRAGSLGEALLPKVLEAGGALGLEAGPEIIAAMSRAQQPEKAITAAKLYFAKYPDAPAGLSWFAASQQQVGAPSNRDAIALIDGVVAKAGGSYWPHSGVEIRSSVFTIAEQNRLPAEMQAQFKHWSAICPGSWNSYDFQRRIGLVQAAAGELEPARQTLLAAAKAAWPVGADASVLLAMGVALPNGGEWIIPLVDEYLARPTRGPQQASVQLLRAHLLLNAKKDSFKALQAVVATPADLGWNIGNFPQLWLENLCQSLSGPRADELVKPEAVALLNKLVATLGIQSRRSNLLLRLAQLGQSLEFADSLNRLSAGFSPNDANALSSVYLPLSQQMVTLNKPELGALVLRSALNRLTGVDSKLRAQASQALFSLSNKAGFAPAEIDDKLPWAPLLRAAASLRMGDPSTAWKSFQENEALLQAHEDKLPPEFLRWVSDRLLQREDEPSREAAEKLLRRWIIANENASAVPVEEKAKMQLQLADVYFKTLRYELSRSECTSLINRYPATAESIDAQFRIGECYLNQKMYVDAAKVFETLAKTKDKLRASRGEFLLGVLAQQRGDTEDAKARFRNVMDLAPASDVADSILYRLSELYGQENRFSDELMLLRSIGLIGSNAKQWHSPGMPLNIVIQDADLGVSRGQSYVPVVVTTSSGDRELVRLESGSAGKGFFRAELSTVLGDAKPGNNVLEVNGSDSITYDYPTEFKKQFSSIAPPQSNIRLAADGDLKVSATEIKEEEEVTFEERLREQRQTSGKQAGLEFRQEFRKGNDLKPGNNIYIQVKDADRDLSKAADPLQVMVMAASGGRLQVTLTETGPHTGVFRGTLKTIEIAANTISDPSQITAGNDNSLRLTQSDRITVTYDDEPSNTGKSRTLQQKIQATYYNASVDFIAYEFSATGGTNVPVQYVKQVRRVDPGERVIVRVTDYDADISDQRDKLKFTLKTSDGRESQMEATETEPFTGVFTKELDIWSPENPNGFKLGPGVTLEAIYLDAQNTMPGAPALRTAKLEQVSAAEPKVAFIPSSVQVTKDAQERIQYTPVASTEASTVKAVAFRPPLSFEIIAPAAAKNSFSEVKATLTTSGGSRIEIICPLSTQAGGKSGGGRHSGDEALEAGRFVGQIFMNLGDKDSPETIVLEPGDTRSLVARRLPSAVRDQQLANLVPVLNLNGQDLITVTYQVSGKDYSDQARLAVPASADFTDNSYEKPVAELFIGDKIFLAVKDLTADASAERDSVDVKLTSLRGESFTVKLEETLSHSGQFTGSFPLIAGEKPVAGDSNMEAWFGDAVTLSFASKTDPKAKFQKTINVVKGTDSALLVFEKKYATERVAIESQFRMAESYFELFKNYRALKQLPQANTALSEGMQILKELSSDYPSKIYEARTDYLLGQFAQELKNYDEAIGYYRRIVQNHGEHALAPDAQYKLGQCYEEKGDMDAASAEYVTLAYTWPENSLVANVVVRIAEYFYTKKEFPTAAEVSKKFVDRFPQHEWAERMLFRAAQCWFKAEKFGEAGGDFDLLVENYPRGKFRADAIFWAGESYRSAGQLSLAFRRYKRATWDYPESDAAKYSRGKLVLPEMVSVADKDVQ